MVNMLTHINNFIMDGMDYKCIINIQIFIMMLHINFLKLSLRTIILQGMHLNINIMLGLGILGLKAMYGQLVKSIKNKN